ncbi:MAG: hypothetical protein IPG71_06030 [bacterium]|nr:hypothetical protein [bacterium]
MRFLLILGAATLFAQVARGAVELRRANTLTYGDENGARVQELIGDVYIVKDSLSINCDNAKYYPDSGTLIFRNNVVLQDGQRDMFADEVTYSDWTEEVNARGRVKIYQDSLSIGADRAVYRERLGSGYLYDDVRMKHEPRGIAIKGGIGYFNHFERSAWVSQDPVLTRRDSTGRVNTEIVGDTITYSDSLGYATALGNVIIARDSLTAFGQLLEFYTDSMYAELTGSPMAISGADTIRGDKMRLFFHDEVLERVEVHGDAVATSPADTLPDAPRQILTGERMTFWITESRLTSALVEGSAIATYYVRDKTGRARFECYVGGPAEDIV